MAFLTTQLNFSIFFSNLFISGPYHPKFLKIAISLMFKKLPIKQRETGILGELLQCSQLLIMLKSFILEQNQWLLQKKIQVANITPLSSTCFRISYLILVLYLHIPPEMKYFNTHWKGEAARLEKQYYCRKTSRRRKSRTKINVGRIFELEISCKKI